MNVHLFPDTSNLELLQKTRDSNARSRREALEYILEESSRYPIVDKDAKLSQPDGRIREEGDNKRSRLSVEGRPRDAIFYFGDFNFRLDMSALVRGMYAHWSTESGHGLILSEWVNLFYTSEHRLPEAVQIFQTRDAFCVILGVHSVALCQLL